MFIDIYKGYGFLEKLMKKSDFSNSLNALNFIKILVKGYYTAYSKT